MTYFELYEQALYKMNYEGLSFADFQKMIEPLSQEIPERNKMKSPEELYDGIVENVHKKDKIIKFVHDWIPVKRELPEKAGMYVVTIYYDDINNVSVTMAVWDTKYQKFLTPMYYSNARVVAWLPLAPYACVCFDSEGKSGR